MYVTVGRLFFEDYKFREYGKKDNSWKHFSRNNICGARRLIQYACATTTSYTRPKKSWLRNTWKDSLSIPQCEGFMCTKTYGIQKLVRCFYANRNLGTFTIPTLYQLFVKTMQRLGMSLKQYRLCVTFFTKKWNDFMPGNQKTTPFCRFTTRRDGGSLHFDIRWTKSVHQKAPEAYSFSTY